MRSISEHEKANAVSWQKLQRAASSVLYTSGRNSAGGTTATLQRIHAGLGRLHTFAVLIVTMLMRFINRVYTFVRDARSAPTLRARLRSQRAHIDALEAMLERVYLRKLACCSSSSSRSLSLYQACCYNALLCCNRMTVCAADIGFNGTNTPRTSFRLFCSFCSFYALLMLFSIENCIATIHALALLFSFVCITHSKLVVCYCERRYFA